MEKVKKEKLVSLGDAVKVRLSSGQIRKIQIVPTSESDPSNGKISNVSPIGKVLIGSKKGDTQKYLVNGKEFEVKILDV